MKNKLFQKTYLILTLFILLVSCKSLFNIKVRDENKETPTTYNQLKDTFNLATINWREYFADPSLTELIDTALLKNQELQIILQEIEISKNEIRVRKGEYLPFVSGGVGTGFDKYGQYTRFGAVDDQLKIKDNQSFPVPFTDFYVGANLQWEADIWKKLHNAQKAARLRYLATIEGRNFMVSKLIAEIAETYYELMAQDNLLRIIEQNIDIQSNILKIINQEKNAGKLTQLAVNRFEAQLLNTNSLKYEIHQRVVELENKINFLTARYPKPLSRNSAIFLDIVIDSIPTGIPAQLLTNRPDIRQAYQNLAAMKIDVKVAQANFYPKLEIKAGLAFQAFNPIFLLNPESILYNLFGDFMAPLINRNALKANYASATAKQLQAVIQYEQTILNAYLDVINQLNKIDNFRKSYQIKTKEVELLNQSITISGNLFYAARADYSEVLLTQREALQAYLELVELKMKLLNGKVNIYRALGGGWK